ncbi:F-box only protein 9-like protein [Leptotrombidium deliense]|uniref:F-box only protein 9 n=1 Tax=Leptotrombidium deliense TaxID=299467 RepID=A0A443SVA8_9ACAR|nr:F-box only protein 9-like protein [Leptotrombidium deliense]
MAEYLCQTEEDNYLSGLFCDVEPTSNEEALHLLRESWKREINLKRNAQQSHKNSKVCSANVEVQAKQWFEKGISFEKAGQFYDAVSCYRKATQLVPDIETKYYRNVQQQDFHCGVDNKVVDRSVREKESYFACDNEVDLLTQFEKLNVDEQGNFCVCQPDMNTSQVHFSALPVELIMYIFKWVVSADLDYRSLEQLSAVCRGFYVISRDMEIWRLGCTQVWGKSNSESIVNEYAGSWRRMYIDKPRLNYNGAYISRTTYIRQGENSFQDADYKPCYLVEYYRYMRFFPDGVMLMLNTPDNPYQSLAKLRWRKARSPVLVGNYRVSGAIVTAVLKRSHRFTDSSSSHYKRSNLKNIQYSEQEFHIVLEIKTIRNKKNFQLSWKGYSVICRRNNQETATTFDLSLNKFPPLSFSRVKSYSTEAQKPLS